jgi:hypothetical protein
MAEKQVLCYSVRRPLSSKAKGATQRGSTIVQSFHNDQTAQKIGRDTSIMNQTADKNTANIDRSEKGKDIVRYRAKSNYGPASSKAGSGSHVRCFVCGERGHASCACPQWRVNLVELEEEEVLPEPTYDDYDDEEEDVDIYPVQGEFLVVQQVMTPRVEEEEWKRHNIFRTQVL